MSGINYPVIYEETGYANPEDDFQTRLFDEDLVEHLAHTLPELTIIPHRFIPWNELSLEEQISLQVSHVAPMPTRAQMENISEYLAREQRWTDKLVAEVIRLRAEAGIWNHR